MTQPRISDTTVTFIDNYCTAYQKLFLEVRSYEAFKRLHLGIAAEIKRKTLPAIAQAVGLNNEQYNTLLFSKSDRLPCPPSPTNFDKIITVLFNPP